MTNFNTYLAQGIGSLPSSLVSIILILISILTVTVALERGYILFRANITLDPEQGRELIRLITAKKYDAALEFCSGKLHPGYRAVARVLEGRQIHPDLLSFAREVIFEEQVGLERFTSFLGTTTTLAPMLGLLGTVTGMIEVFDVMSGIFWNGFVKLLSIGYPFFLCDERDFQIINLIWRRMLMMMIIGQCSSQHIFKPFIR